MDLFKPTVEENNMNPVDPAPNTILILHSGLF